MDERGDILAMLKRGFVTLSLVLFAMMAGLWFCVSRVSIISGERGGDSFRNDHVEAVGAEDGIDPELFSKNVREPVRGGAERLAVAARLREMQRTDDEGLVVETMPDGHQSIHLQGRFQHVTSLVRKDDGSMVPVCGKYLPVEEEEAVDE
jgi:hypothetical protein